jgi:peptidoglycan/LPS O-acetylase OafA/YrhL
MQFYSIWPYFACMAVLLALASIPSLANRFRIGEGRRSNIDGLRGFLAFGVVFHHTAVYHQYLADGHWGFPPSRFYTVLGPASVAMFFMITSYLFWGRVIDKRGAPNWIELYTGRIFRIFPLYLFATGIMVALALALTKFTLHVPLREFLAQVLKWSLGGIVVGPDINGYAHTTLLLAGVTWTLGFEWKFYAALLPLSLAARQGGAHLWFAIVGAIASLALLFTQAQQTDASISISCMSLFFLGMVCASLERRRLTAKLPGWCSFIVIVALLGFVMTSSDQVFSPWLIMALAIIFFLIVSGSDLLGLLSLRSAVILGEMSYSVYLLHGLVFAIVFAWKPVAAFSLSSPLRHWAVVVACLIVVMITASITCLKIERVGVRYGRQVAAALAALPIERRRRDPFISESARGAKP